MSTVTVPLALTIRRCRETDLRALEWEGLFTPHRELIARAFERQHRDANVMLVAETASGFLAGQVWIDLERHEPGRTGTLWALRVHPAFQRLGIGSQLILAAEGELRRRGIRTAEIGVETHNTGARRLYERLGYSLSRAGADEYSYTTPEGEQHTVNVDLWIFRKSLV